MKTFINTSLGESFEIRGEAPEWQRLYERREDYPIGEVPGRGLFLTAGADVQKDRIEVEVVAWGRDKESWSIDYRVLQGDTAAPGVWKKLSAMLEERFPHAGGSGMAIKVMAVDTGYATQAVYAWSRTAPAGRVMPVKGVDRGRYPVQGPSYVDVSVRGRKRRRGAKLWTVCSSVFKSELYGDLRKEPGDGEDCPPGYCHFPKYEPEYFKQLTAEQLVKRVRRNGFATLEWQQTRERNEALDCRVYARAAAEYELSRLSERRARAYEKKLGSVPEAPGAIDADPRQEVSLIGESTSMPHGGSWLGGRHGNWVRR
jgi:phage terminase large subunit GpA-like protein